MPFGNQLKEYREKNNLTQEQEASFFGADFSRQSVSKWDAGNVLRKSKNF